VNVKTAATIAERPSPGAPRPYEFPAVEEHRLRNGLRILVAEMPGRPLIAASLVLRNGAVDEPADVGGATVLAARALSEGTERYDAIQLTEASERLGASLGRADRQRRRPARPPRGRPRAAGRDGPAPDVPGARGRPTP
jgi:hypothetical protein